MKATVAIEVGKPVREVWEFVSNIENMPRWVIGVSEPKRTSGGEFGVGSTFTSKYTYGGKTHRITYEVIGYAVPIFMAIRATTGPFPFQGTLHLEPAGGTTTVKNTVDAGADSVITSVIFVVFGRLIRKMMRKRLRSELEALKLTLEARWTTPSE